MKERIKSAVFCSRTVLEVVVVVVTLLLLLFPMKGAEFRVYGEITQKYLPGTVTAIVDEEFNESYYVEGGKVGNQILRVRLSDGREIEVTNYITDYHNVISKVGTKIIVCADEPGGDIEPYYSVYSYSRIIPVIVIILVFLALMIAVGRRKGFDAFIALLFSLVFILNVSLPMLYSGASAVWVGLLTVVSATAVTMLMIHGVTKQCGWAVISTLIGELIACLIFSIFAAMFNISGFQTSDAQSLLLVTRHTGLDVYHLLLCGMMISSLGAVMDVAVSILSSLREVSLAMKQPDGKKLFTSGISIGRDVIGTMANTLIFAFVGGSLTSMLVFYSHGVQASQLLSSDYLAIELTQGLCSTMAVILTVPAASLIGAIAFGKRK